MLRFASHLGTAVLLLTGCFRSSNLDETTDAGPDVDVVLDASALDVSTFDAPSGADGGSDIGMMVSCEPQDARPGACASDICDALGPPPRVYWNGHSCESLGCGRTGEECLGTDCDATYESMELCEAAHSHCASLQCRSGGGMWRFWAECDCGFSCGVNGFCRACEGPSCDCGPFANFVPGMGCVRDDRCIPPPFVEPADAKCERTGGTWGPFCGHSRCGVRSADDCTSMACDCPGPTEFDPDRGCIQTDRCYRGEGRCDFPGVLCPLGTECGGRGFCAPVCIDG